MPEPSKDDDTVNGRTKTWRGMALSLMRRASEHEIMTRAAALSFYFIFALFPMILSLLAILGLFAQDRALHSDMVRQFSRLMPSSAFSLVETTMVELARYSSRWKLALGLALALWSGSGGMGCIMDALDRGQRIRSSRPWWKKKIIALALTALISALSLVALAIVLAGGSLSEFIGHRTGLSHAAVQLWEIVEWPIALFFMLLSLDLIYRWGPAVRQHWRWITAGSAVGVLVWISASLLFRVYLQYFSTYSRSYGSLGAVMVLLLWLYITGLAIVLGGEINAEIAERGLR